MWKPIFLFTIISAAFAALASFIITPEYESTSIIFPVESSSFSKAIISDMSNQGFLAFGDEEETEKMLQVLHSDRIRALIIKKFNLYKHYEIDRAEKYAKTTLEETYNENINISRTEYLSIEITVRDKNPKLAADIANSITSYIDTVLYSIKSERGKLAMKLLMEKYDERQVELDIVRDSMQKLHRLGFHNYNAQAERYSEAYAKALAAGRLDGAARVKKELDKLAEHANDFNNLNQTQSIVTDRLYFLKKKIQETEIAINESIPNKFVVEEAEVSEKKAYPIRSLIVLMATFASFVFIVLLLMIINYSRKSE